jgi:hypothetical protein
VIQAGRQGLVVHSVPVATNPHTRASRLFRGVPDYLRRAGPVMFRAYAMYQPVQLLGRLGTLLLLVGVVLGARFMYHYVREPGCSPRTGGSWRRSSSACAAWTRRSAGPGPAPAWRAWSRRARRRGASASARRSAAVPPEAPAVAPTRRVPPWVRSLVQAVLVAAVLGILGWRVSRDASSLRSFSPKLEAGTLAPAFLAGALAYVGLPSVYVLLLRRLGLYEPRFRAFYYRMWLQAFFFRYLPGKVANVLLRAELGRRCGLRPAVTLVLVGWESLLVVLGASVTCGLCLAGLSGGAGRALPWLALSPLLVLGLLLLFPRLLAFASREPRLRKRFGDLASLDLGHRAQLSLVLAYALVWLAMGTAFFFVCRLFVPFGAAELPAIVFWFVASYVIGFVSSIAPAGIGVREGLLVLGLSRYLPEAQAAAVAVAGRLWLTLVEMICIGCACLIPMPADPPPEP